DVFGSWIEALFCLAEPTVLLRHGQRGHERDARTSGVSRRRDNMVNGVADVAKDRKVPTTPHWTYRQLNLLVRTGSDLVALVAGLAARPAAARVRSADMQVTPVRHRMAGISYADLAQTPADGRALAIERHGVQLAGSPTPTPRSARRVPPRPSPSQPHTGP